jgi:hypothetical protein
MVLQPVIARSERSERRSDLYIKRRVSCFVEIAASRFALLAMTCRVYIQHGLSTPGIYRDIFEYFNISCSIVYASKFKKEDAENRVRRFSRHRFYFGRVQGISLPWSLPDKID